jgi:periplasmic divalent cation tolerance protein
MTKNAFRIVLITASGPQEAEKISSALVAERLAACVNTLPRVRSRYRWKGKVETASETLLIAKTRKDRMTRLIRRVKELHSYSVPEIIALPIAEGSAEYLAWIGASL